MEKNQTYNRIRLLVLVQTILSHGATVNVAHALDLSRPRIHCVEIVQRASDKRIRRPKIVMLNGNPTSHR